MVKLIPEKPSFRTGSEEMVWQELSATLPDNATLMANLRLLTERVETEIDLLILIPGQGTLVIEVKGGICTLQSNGHFSQRSHSKSEQIDPIEQLTRSLHFIQNWMKERTSTHILTRAEMLLVMPHSNIDHNDLPASLPSALFADERDIGTLASKVAKAFKFRHTGPSAPTQSQIDVLVESLRGHVVDVTNLAQLGHLSAQRSSQIEELVAENFRVLDLTAEMPRFDLRGGAGTGKTALALELARRKSQSGKRVALLCYSRILAAHLVHVTETWPSSQRPALVRTLHGLMYDLTGLTAPPDSADFFDSVMFDQFTRAISSRANGERFDTVIVDESQDFDAHWWDAVKQLLRDPEEGELYLFGDTGQGLFGRSQCPLQLPPLTLDMNLRNTTSIGKVAALFRNADNRLLGFSGPEVLFCEVPSGFTAFEVADDAVAYLLDQDWAQNSIALLTTKSRHEVHRDAVEGGIDILGANASARAKGELRRSNQHRYEQSLWDDREIFYGTVAGFKGLDRSAVVLCIDGFHDNADPEQVMYVGLTRARDVVIVVGKEQMLREVLKPAQVDALVANPIKLTLADPVS